MYIAAYVPAARGAARQTSSPRNIFAACTVVAAVADMACGAFRMSNNMNISASVGSSTFYLPPHRGATACLFKRTAPAALSCYPRHLRYVGVHLRGTFGARVGANGDFFTLYASFIAARGHRISRVLSPLEMDAARLSFCTPPRLLSSLRRRSHMVLLTVSCALTRPRIFTPRVTRILPCYRIFSPYHAALRASLLLPCISIFPLARLALA